MALKDWVKTKDNPNYIVFASKEQKDYNAGQPKHLQVGEGNRFFSKNVISIQKGWSMADVQERKESKAVWTVRDYYSLNKYCKSRSEALAFANNYMRSH